MWTPGLKIGKLDQILDFTHFFIQLKGIFAEFLMLTTSKNESPMLD
jgi:hypothetical protein